MRTVTISLYISICVLSGMIIGAALLTQYVWGEPFYDFVGSAIIRGSQINATNRRPHIITRATVEYRGFIFDFDEPLVQIADQRVRSRHTIQSYRKQNNTLMLSFAGGIELHFHIPAEETDELLIRIRDTAQLLQSTGADYLAFNYRCPQEACVAEERIISVNKRGDTNYLYLPPDSVFDRAHIQISLRNPVRTLQLSTTYTPGLTASLHTIATRLMAQAPETAAQLRSEFIRNAYENWQQYSYIAAAGRWLDRDGNARFTEDIMIANLAEALVRGDYTRTFNAMRRAYQQNQELTTIRALPYIGDSFTLVPAFSVAEQRTESTIEQLVDTDALFDNMQTLVYLYFRAPAETYQLFNQYVMNSDYFNLNVHQLLNMLQYLLFDPESNLITIEEIIMNRIIPRVFVSHNGMFIKDNEERIDFITTMRATAILRQFIASADRPHLETIIDALEYSTLSFADDHSYLPQYASLRDDRIINVHGYIDPAAIYQYIADGAQSSRYTLLDAEQRLWMMSAIDVQAERSTRNRVELRAVAAAAQSFYIVIGNSRRPQRIRMAGTDYQLDAAFQTRIRGWYWFSDDNILLIKFHQSDQSNRIVIAY